MVISIYDTSREGTPEQFDKKRAREVRESLSLSLEDLTSIFSSKKQGRKIIIRTLNEYENGDKTVPRSPTGPRGPTSADFGTFGTGGPAGSLFVAPSLP
jgi:hypothetical protein